MSKIDLDKFISSLINDCKVNAGYIHTRSIGRCLEEQGLKYVNGEIVEIAHEQKFKNGQWIVWRNKCYKVNYNGCGYELIDQNNLSTSLEYGTVDENAKLWTIQDAKDGDVLWHSDSASNGIFIFKEIRHDGKVLCYCDYDSEDHFCTGEYHTCCWSYDKYIQPATKKQRDHLFEKMKEAGYEYNLETKVLRKIERKKES